MLRLPVRLRRLDPSVPLPEYQTPGAVAFDIAARTNMTVAPEALALIPTGLIVEVPQGYTLLLCARSSTPGKLGLHIPHGVGVIDQDYHGPDDELLIQYYNHGTEPVTITAGQRIAQGMFVPVAIATFEETDHLSFVSRGGFGNTGS